MFNGANHGMGSANYSPELRAQLLAAVPPAALAANPNIVPGADILKIYDVGAWIAGPIVRDKLWFSGRVAPSGARISTCSATTTRTAAQVLDDNLMWTTSAKVAWQVTRTAQLSYFNNLQYKLIGHRNGGGTFAESRARNLNDKYPDIHQVKFTSTIGSRIVDRRVVQPVPRRRQVRPGAGGQGRGHLALRRGDQHLHRGAADLSRSRDVPRSGDGQRRATSPAVTTSGSATSS